MGFEIVEETPRTIWAHLSGSSIPYATATPRLYVGQLVSPKGTGIDRLAQAIGFADEARRRGAVSIAKNVTSTATGNQVFGVVVGTNRRSPVFSTTYNAEYIDYAAPYSATNDDYFGVGGPYSAGEQRAAVKIALINPTTVLRAPLFNSSATTMTAITLGTVTACSSGRTVTTATLGTVGISGLSTIYFRTGAAAGTYRVCNDTSATVHTWREHLASSTGAATGLIGDKVVKVNLPCIGKGRMQIDSLGMWIDSGSSCTANFFSINVLRLDLSTAGKEFVEFQFDPVHFTCASGVSS